MNKPSFPLIFLQYSTDFGGEKEQRWGGENWDLREQQAQPLSGHAAILGVSQALMILTVSGKRRWILRLKLTNLNTGYE